MILKIDMHMISFFKGQKFINRFDCCGRIFALITIIGKKKMITSKLLYNVLGIKVSNKISIKYFNEV